MAIIIIATDETRRDGNLSFSPAAEHHHHHEQDVGNLSPLCLPCPSRRSMQPLDNLAHYATTLPL